ncbi:MAG: T9SS C-terminal target domain-containing protein [Flavobacteriales bacterium]|nr:T9SS C-terminal target domain-containing protein [Flavobacteriales bacterium]
MNTMQLTRSLAITLCAILAVGVVSARRLDGPRSGRSNTGQIKAAGCSPATAITELDLNNVRTQVETGGNKWQDRSAGLPAYEVPKTVDRSGAHSIFAGSLWLGGFSPDNQLKLAAVLFRTDGNDFWPGPLTNTGDASIQPEVCLQYDRTWKTLRQDAALHRAYHQCRIDPDCDVNEEYPNYSTPSIFYEWPAHGSIALNQDYNLAPYFDFDGSDEYDPDNGDYPGFDLDGEIDCKNRFREDPIPLFGDQNIWWVFNDKGNAHTETGGLPIGMEIRAQAFAFSTNDEVNNMTFYNYLLINQGTQTLRDTYFGQWVDTDLGNADDDFVGCDVQRGLGYCYNGDNNDEDGQAPGYGVQPPAIGVDFFEGPFVDYDDLDNPLTLDCDSAFDFHGIPYKGIGIGYSDGVVDNERYGMRAFLYHNRNTGVTGDPSIAIHYYNYLRAVWKDNSPNLYGGTGHQSDAEADPNTPAFYMFPGDSDPVGWGTGCAVPGDFWTEESSGNQPFDRRFIQSAGPFTLEPGAYNNVTVGVVWARASGGGPFESVEEVRRADDKAQALFDNCFQILNGPDAPELSIVELDRELILTITNPPLSNNFGEAYEELDPIIPEDATDRFYRFQGYQVYQLADATVSVAELQDINKARLVFQCDIEDAVEDIVNFIPNPQIGIAVPTLMVEGLNEGISHSFRITEDRFSQSNPRLVNFKTYYYMAIAYGYNNYEDYDQEQLTGQALPYLAGRKSASGSIRAFAGIPHKNDPENGGTILNAAYGDRFQITRIEGQGNGGLSLEFDNSTVDVIMNGAPWRADELKYTLDHGPLGIKVIDPLSVPASNFELWMDDPDGDGNLADATWALVALDLDADGNGAPDTVFSERSISILNEQLIPEWGMSVTIEQVVYENSNRFTDLVESSIEFDDPDLGWLSGVPDGDAQDALNWIRAGTSNDPANSYNDYVGVDDDEVYEGVLTQQFDFASGGTWSPFPLIGDTAFQPGHLTIVSPINFVRISDINSIMVRITPDKSKWTRAAVLEMEENPGLAEGGAEKMELRGSNSVDKNGRRSGTPGCNEDEATMNGTQPNGMGWFPGYAIDLETGERLNMAFGEATFWGGRSGRDMLWNPSDTLVSQLGQPIFGGQHFIYVFGNRRRENQNADFMPGYDEGAYLYERLNSGTLTNRLRVYRACNWVGSAMRNHGFSYLPPEQGLVPTGVTIRIVVGKPYRPYVQPYADYEPVIDPQRNNGLPLYTFGTGDRAPVVMDATTAETACDMIDIVPNPYFGFSSYEQNRLDNRVKFINLPRMCNISIYNVSGTLVRKYKKDNDLTYLDWDLRNQVNVPVAGGVYICHIEVPGVCERVVRWFGVMRPVDLESF